MERGVRDEVELEGEESPFDDSEPGTSNRTASEEISDGHSKFRKAVDCLREELQLSGGKDSTTVLDIPVFVGHGTEDEKAQPVLAKEAVELLQPLQFDVEFQQYEGLGHWYSPEMLRDIILFLQRSTEVQPVKPVEGV
jgi:pimeloyl-ACP methyl ester carboxylesterase